MGEATVTHIRGGMRSDARKRQAALAASMAAHPAGKALRCPCGTVGCREADHLFWPRPIADQSPESGDADES